MSSVVDNSDPEKIRAAIEKVNSTPGLRDQLAMDVLLYLMQSPDNAASYADLLKEFSGLDLHFGWFCRRVAEELGDTNAPSFALTDRVESASGTVMRLKPSVVAAMGG